MIRRAIERIYHGLPVLRELFQVRDSIRHEVSTLKAAHFMLYWEIGLESHPRYGDPKRLLRYGLQVNSQSGEDGVIHEIFRRIGTASRVFVEIGLEDGLESNTAFLIAKGWTGFWIDGRDDCRATLSRAGVPPERVRAQTAFVTRENAASLLAGLGVPKEFDLLSIDVDQNTYYVWEALREYRPRVAVIEYNAALPADLDWKVRYEAGRVWDESQNFGASLKALERLGRERGYALVGCDLAGTNAFFVREDLAGDRFAAPFTAENHWEPIRYALLGRRGHRRAILDAGTTS
ncbi:MAG: hypothetical protein ACM3JJ_13905 [Hyphomicrobiales bacterium]